MITDLVQIKRLGEKKRDENGRFRKYMKSRVFVERQFRKAAEEVTDGIDCRQCHSDMAPYREEAHRIHWQSLTASCVLCHVAQE